MDGNANQHSGRVNLNLIRKVQLFIIRLLKLRRSPSLMPVSSRRSVHDEDPLSIALAPPPDEAAEDRAARLERELEAKRISDSIDEELNRQRIAEKKGTKPVRILLLGQSESGKSTTLKNFQLISSAKIFQAERLSWRAVVHLNVVRSIRLILDAISEESNPANPDCRAMPPELLALEMRLRPIDLVEQILARILTPGSRRAVGSEEPKSAPNLPGGSNEVALNSTVPWKNAFQRLLSKAGSSEDDPDSNEPQESREARQLLQACAGDMAALWNDQMVQDILRVQNLRLEDLSGFFLDSLDRVTALSYQPTNDDILKARLKTLGVSEHHFNLKAGPLLAQSWIVYDVGGARSLRSAWVPYFDQVDAIIFLAPLNCFDQALVEDESVNRLEDSFLLWKIVVSSPLLKNTGLILFLNKCDLLKAKLAAGIKFNDYVLSYGNKPNDFENTSNYLKKKFAAIAKAYAQARHFYTYFTSVTDVQSTAEILGSVRDKVLSDNLKKTHLQ
ncbi:guanine nucleotide binding protein, alpha subunit [Mycena polygramma]|nr:guanine nucleotide binding protein, alpha subunit [Mycena polygramma]